MICNFIVINHNSIVLQATNNDALWNRTTNDEIMKKYTVQLTALLNSPVSIKLSFKFAVHSSQLSDPSPSYPILLMIDPFRWMHPAVLDPLLCQFFFCPVLPLPLHIGLCSGVWLCWTLCNWIGLDWIGLDWTEIVVWWWWFH